MSKKIEPTGAGRHEERAEHESDESASVDGGDDQQREADADESQAEDGDADSVEGVHATRPAKQKRIFGAFAQGAALTRRRRR